MITLEREVLPMSVDGDVIVRVPEMEEIDQLRAEGKTWLMNSDERGRQLFGIDISTFL